MTYKKIDAACAAAGLYIVAAFSPAIDLRPEGARTLFLLGPREPGFWSRVQSDTDFQGPNPLDHWSKITISRLGKILGAQALFPFGGPTVQPFVSWALASGQVWQSPVGLLVDSTAGLFVSFRGALAFDRVIALPEGAYQSPCNTCVRQPCRSACPAGALNSDRYDIPTCHDWLDKIDGKSCLEGGCLVRRSCPSGQSYGRLEAQSAHHMRYFHKG